MGGDGHRWVCVCGFVWEGCVCFRLIHVGYWLIESLMLLVHCVVVCVVTIGVFCFLGIWEWCYLGANWSAELGICKETCGCSGLLEECGYLIGAI